LSEPALKGRVVLVTRPGGGGEKLAAALRGAGAEVHLYPALRIDVGPAPDAEPFDAAAFDRLLFTSRNGVLGLSSTMVAWDGLPPCWAVGNATAALIEAQGGKVWVTGTNRGMADLAEQVLTEDPPTGLRVLWLRGQLAHREALSPLLAAGAVIEDRVVYRTLNRFLEEGPPPEDILDRVDLVHFASPSAVTFLFEVLTPSQRERLRVHASYLAQGPTTQAACEAAWADPRP